MPQGRKKRQRGRDLGHRPQDQAAPVPPVDRQTTIFLVETNPGGFARIGGRYTGSTET